MSEDPVSQSTEVETPSRRWASSKVELAEILGIDRRTLGNWAHRENCPTARDNGLYLVSEWIKFAQTIGSPTAAGRSAGYDELKREDLRLRIEQRQQKLDEWLGQYTRTSTIEPERRALAEEFRRVATEILVDRLPGSYPTPVDAARARELNKAALDEICERLSHPLASEQVASKH